MTSAFVARHIGTDGAAQQRMLEVLGYPDVDALLARAVPAAIQVDAVPDSVIPAAAAEHRRSRSCASWHRATVRHGR